MRYLWVYVVICILLGSIIGCSNQEKIPSYSQECYEFFSKQHVAEVSSYFYSKYGIDLIEGSSNWDTNYDGQVPSQKLDKITRAAIARFQVTNEQCKEYGIDAPLDYADLLERHKANNKTRKENVEKGQVIYGPEELSLLQYYFDTYAKLELTLQQVLQEQLFKPTDKELKAYYEVLKTTMIEPHSGLAIAYLVSDSYALDNPKVVKLFADIKTHIHNNQQVPVFQLGDQYGIDIYEEEIVITTDPISKEDNFLQTLDSIFYDLAVDDISPINTIGQYVGMIWVKEKERHGHGTLDENRYLVQLEYGKKQYGDYIQTLTESRLDLIE